MTNTKTKTVSEFASIKSTNESPIEEPLTKPAPFLKTLCDMDGVIEFVDPATLPPSSGGVLRMPVTKLRIESSPDHGDDATASKNEETDVTGTLAVAAEGVSVAGVSRTQKASHDDERKKSKKTMDKNTKKVAHLVKEEKHAQKPFVVGSVWTVAAVVLLGLAMILSRAVMSFDASSNALTAFDRFDENDMVSMTKTKAKAMTRNVLRITSDAATFVAWTTAGPILHASLSNAKSDVGLNTVSGNVLDLAAGIGANLAHLNTSRIESITMLERNTFAHATLASVMQTAMHSTSMTTQVDIPSGIDLTIAEFAPNTFDAIYGVFALCALPTHEERVAAINKIHTWLKPGGVWMFIEPIEAGRDTWQHNMQHLIAPMVRGMSKASMQVGAAASGCDPVTDILTALYESDVSIRNSWLLGSLYDDLGWRVDKVEQSDTVVPVVWGRVFKKDPKPISFMDLANTIVDQIVEFFKWALSIE